MSYGQKTSVEFFERIIDYIAEKDSDYKEIPFAVCFYNKNAGVKAQNSGDSPITATYSYLITGRDAVEFQDKLITPLKDADENDKKIKTKYFFKGLTFVKRKSAKFLNEKKLELHAIFTGEDLIKIGFYPIKGKNNPHIKLGYK